MPDSIIKKQFIAMQPKGVMGNIEEGSDEDKMYDGSAEDYDVLRGDLELVSQTRNPHKTKVFTDLEYEYGMFVKEGMTQQQRKDQLAALVYARKSNGDLDAMEEALHRGGFLEAHVFDNSPMVDPETLQDEYIVNGDMWEQRVDYTNTCTTFSDQKHCTTFSDQAHCGTIQDVFTEVIYDDPTVNTNMVFFVCKSVTRDGSGAIIATEKLDLPNTSRLAFRRIVLRHKPLGTWGALAVNWTGDMWTGFGYFPFGLNAFGL